MRPPYTRYGQSCYLSSNIISGICNFECVRFVSMGVVYIDCNNLDGIMYGIDHDGIFCTEERKSSIDGVDDI